MKFSWRLGFTLAYLAGPMAWFFLSNRPFESFPEETIKVNGRKDGGLAVASLWDIDSLHNVKPIDRASFKKFYNDDRQFFGDGNESPEVLKKDTKPYRNPHLEEERDFLNDRNVQVLLEENVLKSSSMRVVENIRKLLIASDLIKSNKNLTKGQLKGVLDINKRIAKSSRVAEEYGAKFQLNTTERNTLIASVHGRLEENQINTPEMKRLGVRPIPTKYKYRMLSGSDWYKFYADISTHHMYEEGKQLEQILSDLHTMNATFFAFRPNDTRLHGKLTLGQRYPADFIPIRFSRTQETRVNHHHKDDFQRHVAEIAAFHLDRALGFRRAVPTSGRMFNIFKELRSVFGSPMKIGHFVVSLEGNECLVGHCKMHCRSNEIICGTPGELESAVHLRISIIDMTSWDYPWKDSKRPNQTAKWLTDYGYCTKIKNIYPYNSGRRMLDIIDLAIFDFLQGNLARKTYKTFTAFGNEGFIIHNDNELGFGKAFRDDTSILAPLNQCCMIRYTTLHTLLDYAFGPFRLSEVVGGSLDRDPLPGYNQFC